MRERVLVTGIGLVSSLDSTTWGNWRALRAGRRGVRSLALEPRLPLRYRGAALGALPMRNVVRQRRTIKLMAADARCAVVAAEEALRSAGYADPLDRPQDMALVVAGAPDSLTVGAQIDSMFTCFDDAGWRRLSMERWFRTLAAVNPLDCIRLGANMVAAHVSINGGLCGEPTLVTSSPGVSALGEAFRSISAGASSIALVGGADAAFNPGMAELVVRLGYRLPERARQEVEARRVLLGCGAAFMVFESASRVRKRGVRAYAEVLGYGEGHGEGEQRQSAYEPAIRRALDTAGIGPGDLALVHLDSLAGHGVAPEESALCRLGGEHARRLRAISCRAAVGCLGTAAGFFDAAIVALALRFGSLPPMPRRWARHVSTLRPVLDRPLRARPQRALLCNLWMEGPAGALVLGAARS